MEALPYEMLFKILLETRNINMVLKMCSTNTIINQICNDDYFWKQRFKRDHPNLSKIQPSIGSNYRELYKWIYSTGIEPTLCAPPIISYETLMFIKPEPPYTLAEVVVVDIVGIGGTTHYNILSDISLYKDKDSGIWDVYIFPRNTSTEGRHRIINADPIMILNNRDELITYVNNLINDGYYQL